MISKHQIKDGNEIIIKQLTILDMERILSLQRKVREVLVDKTFLQSLTEEEYAYILNGKGMMVGAFLKDQLIAFRAMLEPALDEEHLGKDIELPRKEWSFVIYSEISIVDSNFRGNGLQLLLGKIIMEKVDQKRHRYIFTTVAPFNIASLKDKFFHGLQIVSLGHKYENMLRYTMMKNLLISEGNPTSFESRNVLMGDIIEQQLLLDEGWIGTGIEEVDNHWVVRYEMKKS